MSDHPDVTAGDSAARCPFLSQLEQMPRLTEARYADAVGEIRQGADPMEVARGLFDQEGEMPNEQGASAMFTTWGQFIDHDLSLTPEAEAEDELMLSDAFPHGVGRSEYMDGTGEDTPREFGNALTWQMDASMVYGSNEGREADLRSHEGGRLKTTEDPYSVHDLMPQATPETVMAGDTEGEDAVYLAGDVRANENPNLLTMHTLFVREHNYWADRIAAENPDWSDDQVFEAARSVVEYQIQKITYQEWLPLLVDNAVPTDIESIEHDADVNGQVALEFSTVAFRFGHTLVSSRIERLNDDGTEAEGGHEELMDAFFDPDTVREQGIDAYLRGIAGQSAQDLDTKVVDALNFFLATPEGVSGFSLPALNLMRAGDHGMGTYVEVRAELLGDIDPAALDPDDFSIITADPDLQAELASVYDDVIQVDIWVGGLAEDAAGAGMLGPTFTHIVSDQFIRTATADPDFGDLPDLSDALLADIRAGGLADVILRNSDVDHIQDNPFLMETRALTEVLSVDGTGGDDAIAVTALDVAGSVSAGAGNDEVTVIGGSILRGGAHLGRGDDAMSMTSGRSDGAIVGGRGDDALTFGGTATAPLVRGGGGDDTICVEESAQLDRIQGGRGDDLVEVTGRAAVDTIATGKGDDIVRLEGGDVSFVDGGDGADTLQVGPGAQVDHDGDDSGTITWDDGRTTRFDNVEFVTCFTRGTRIVTAAGKRPIEALRVGARVLTLDHGLQPIRWIGRTRVLAEGALAPIRIDARALGNTRRLDVSPQHRMLLTSAHAEMLFGVSDVLAPAVALTERPGIARHPGGVVDYIHILFDCHEIVLAEGIPSESFHPGALALSSLEQDARAELLTLFPDLARNGYGADARPSLRGREARLLARDM